MDDLLWTSLAVLTMWSVAGVSVLLCKKSLDRINLSSLKNILNSMLREELDSEFVFSVGALAAKSPYAFDLVVHWDKADSEERAEIEKILAEEIKKANKIVYLKEKRSK